jgi:hypothetical protein
VAELEPSEDEATSVAGPVADASGATLVLDGFAPLRTGSAVESHLALEVGCGAAVFPDAVVRAWLDCPPPEATVAAVGLAPLVCVPFPSVPALPRGEPPRPLSESLAWRIAWRTG